MTKEIASLGLFFWGMTRVFQKGPPFTENFPSPRYGDFRRGTVSCPRLWKLRTCRGKQRLFWGFKCRFFGWVYSHLMSFIVSILHDDIEYDNIWIYFFFEIVL